MPADSFAQLRVCRRPYLAEDVVRDAFHRLAAEHHPDKTGGDSAPFAQLTAAFEVLRNPVTRLKHLIDLENLASSGVQPGVPPDLVELFPAVAQSRQQIAAAIERRRSAPNALARSLAMVDTASARRSAEQLNQQLEALYSAAIDKLREIDTDWPGPAARAGLPLLHARLAFLAKWRDQLCESLLQLQLS